MDKNIILKLMEIEFGEKRENDINFLFPSHVLKWHLQTLKHQIMSSRDCHIDFLQSVSVKVWCHDIQHNDTQNNDT